jgi:predicted metal-dependent hydrolase
MAESPDYEVRVSRRARHARLSVSYAGRVTVVIPERFPRSRVPEIVSANLSWIERARQRFETEGARISGRPAPERPERLQLRLIDQELPVVYRSRSGAARVTETGGLLVVSAPPEDEAAQRRAVKRYLARRARHALAPRLEGLAATSGVTFSHLSIRAQQTRWGSCSPSGAISLNSALLFLPEALVDYVLLHELCHRRELNHSARFWALLTEFEPESERLRKELKSAWHFVPAWLAA